MPAFYASSVIAFLAQQPEFIIGRQLSEFVSAVLNRETERARSLIANLGQNLRPKAAVR